MKRFFIVSLLSLSIFSAQAQSIESRISYIDQLPTATFVRAYSLSAGGVETGTNVLCDDNKYQFDRTEFELAVKYAALNWEEGNKIDPQCTYVNMRDALDAFTSYSYRVALLNNLQSMPRDYDEFEGVSGYRNLWHNRLFQNKTFRKFGMRIAKQLIKELVEFYPKDFQRFLSQQIQYAIDFMNDIPNHRYHVEWEINEYGYGGLEMYDGEESSYVAAQNIEGIILRRMLLNEIPLEELKSFANEMLAVVREADTQNNPDIALIIRLNEDLAYCVGCEEPYFVSYFPQEQYVDGKGLSIVYSKLEPFELSLDDRMNGWGCNYDIFITAIEHYNEPTYIHDEEGKIITHNNDLYLYDFHRPTYGFGHCFVESNISKIEIDGFLRIHNKLY